MIDGIPESPHGEQQPIKEVQAGEWFVPFAGRGAYHDEKGQSVSINLKDVGEFDLTASVLGKGFFTSKTNAIVMLPDRDTALGTDDLKRLETEVVKIGANCWERKYAPKMSDPSRMFPYNLEVKSPNGEIYAASFGAHFANWGLHAGNFFLAAEFGPEDRLLLAPNTEFVLREIEARFIQKGVK